MKVVFFNRFFHPDPSATSQILSDLAFHLAKGAEVHVVTSAVPGGEAAREQIHGVTIHRVAPASTTPHGLPHRALQYWRYYRGARRAARELLDGDAIAVAKTDPPLLTAAIAPIARARGARFVAWLQDLFPEVAKEYGIPGMEGPAGAYVARIRNESLSHADRVVAIGDRMAERVAALPGVDASRLRVIPNWADGAALVPDRGAAKALRAQWGLEGKFVVGYSGNLGRVHEFDTLLTAAALLRGRPDVAFLFVGRGPRLGEVQEAVKREGLSNVSFQPLQARHSLSESLNLPDVHAVVLKPEFEGLVVPSKLYGIMAVGRPTLFVGDPRGEVANVLAAAQGGVSVASGDATGLAREMLRVRDDPVEGEAMGQRAREAFTASFDMPIAFGRWEALLAECCGTPKAL